MEYMEQILDDSYTRDGADDIYKFTPELLTAENSGRVLILTRNKRVLWGSVNVSLPHKTLQKKEQEEQEEW